MLKYSLNSDGALVWKCLQLLSEYCLSALAFNVGS
jgi:hypothetical protein